MLSDSIEKMQKKKDLVYVICKRDHIGKYDESCKTLYNEVFFKDVDCIAFYNPKSFLYIVNKYVYPNMPTLRRILESNIKYNTNYFPIFTKEGFILKEYNENEFFFIIYTFSPYRNRRLLDILREGSEREDLGFLNKPLTLFHSGRFKDIFETIDDLIKLVGNPRIYIIPTDYIIRISTTETIKKRYKKYDLKIKFNKMTYGKKRSFIKYLELSF